jgi:hypothetical protein
VGLKFAAFGTPVRKPSNCMPQEWLLLEIKLASERFSDAAIDCMGFVSLIGSF